MIRTKALFAFASVVVIAVAIIAIGTTVASGQTEIHVIALTADQKVTFVDVRGDGSSVGDRVVVRDRLRDEGGIDQVGTAHWDGVILRRPQADDRLFLWNAVFDLVGGQLMLQGTDVQGQSESTFAVMGGTGAYAAAQGDVDLIEAPGQTEFVIHLT